MSAGALLLCQNDPWLQEAKAQVISCREWPADVAIAGGKAKKKKKSQSSKKQWEIILSDTILYPEGGGQPTDFGTLTQNGESRHVSIVMAHPESNLIVHKTDAPLEPGEDCTISVDWPRRFDHMQHHTGQHLISAVFRDMFKLETGSWWLATYPQDCTIDLRPIDSTAPTPPTLTPTDLAAAESKINNLIRSALPITIHTFPTAANASEFASSHPKFIPPPMPDSGAPLRIIQIPDLDYNPCGGTHVSSTAQIGSVKLTGFTTKGSAGRLSFVVGERLLKRTHDAFERETQMGALLSTSAESFVPNVQSLCDESRKLKAKVKSLEGELAVRLGKELAGRVTEKKEDGILGVVEVREGGEVSFLGAVARAFGDAVQKREGQEGVVLCLVSEIGFVVQGWEMIEGGKEEVEKVVKEVGKAVVELGGGKGGGRGMQFQGKGEKLGSSVVRSEIVKKVEEIFCVRVL